MRGTKILLLMTLSLILLLATALPAAAASYEDTSGHWAEAEIERWSSLQVIQGADGLFRPDEGITRGEMALILDRVMSWQTLADNSFRDLDETWYTEAVLKANAAGVMLGYDNLVRPTDGISRQEAALMIARACGLDSLSPSGQPLYYLDADSIAPWSLPVVALLTEGGYISDSPEYFRPQEPITRAETVVILNNLITRLWRSDGLFSTAVVGNAVVAGSRAMIVNSFIQGDLLIVGGKTEQVVLIDTAVSGRIINKSNAQVTLLGTHDQPDSVFYGDKILPLLPNIQRNTYAATDFTTVDGRLVYDNGRQRSSAGIDVSEHQQVIDWEAVAEDGIEFAFIRLGYRGYTEGKIAEDAFFRQNLEGAKDSGLDVGVYFYSSAISVEEALEEAEFVLSKLRGVRLDYPVVFDWETVGAADSRTKQIDPQLLTDCAIAFCERIADGGYQPMIYANSVLAYTFYDLSRLSDYPLWYAAYNTTPEFYYSFDIWQYTSSGAVDGINGRVDMNLGFGSY